jgi:ribosomal protein S18 acetylase RimI-like enzyme
MLQAQNKEIGLRTATRGDSRAIAELFRMSSGGVADYIWQLLKPDYPGLDLLDIGEQRYAREGVNFSCSNCTIAEHDGAVLGMLHAYEMPETEEPETDPVLRPYAELEAPGSLYISGVALFPEYRGLGIGSRLMDAALDDARERGLSKLSLIAFEQNQGSWRLYLRLGYDVVDQRPVVPHPLIRYTGNALLMTRPVR